MSNVHSACVQFAQYPYAICLTSLFATANPVPGIVRTMRDRLRLRVLTPKP